MIRRARQIEDHVDLRIAQRVMKRPERLDVRIRGFRLRHPKPDDVKELIAFNAGKPGRDISQVDFTDLPLSDDSRTRRLP